MKKRDKEKIREAFDIPEPERKSEFLSIHGEKFSKKSPAVPRPLKFRYAPTLVMAAVLIGLWGVIKPNEILREKPGRDNIIIESTDETSPIVTTTAAEQISVTSAAKKTENKTVTTSAVSSGTNHVPASTQQPAATVLATEYESPETTATTDVQHIITSSVNNHPPATAVTKTTAKKTSSAAVTSIVTTAGKTSTVTSFHEVRVTTVPPLIPDDDLPLTDGVITDLTVTPETVYTKTDEIYQIGNIDMPNNNRFPSDSNADFDLCISGRVMEIFYTRANNKPYTQLDLLVTDIMTDEGQLNSCIMISVYIPGGYMPSDEYFAIYPDRKPYDGNYTVYDSAGIDEPPEIGDAYRFFLNRGGKGIPEGAYVLASENPASMDKI